MNRFTRDFTGVPGLVRVDNAAGNVDGGSRIKMKQQTGTVTGGQGQATAAAGGLSGLTFRPVPAQAMPRAMAAPKRTWGL